MKRLQITQPEGFVLHVTGTAGAGKTTLIGDMLFNELENGPCAYLYTRREGNEKQGGWTVLPNKVLTHPNFEGILLESYQDLEELSKEWRKKPRRAIGIDTSTGLELLIKTMITGSETKELVSRAGKYQHKEFKSRLCEKLQDLREISRYTMLVSPAVPTTYNMELGDNDTGPSQTSIDAEKRLGPDGENQDAKLKLIYLCDYAFHIKRKENPSTGKILGYELVAEQNLKLNTKHRVPLGNTPLTNIPLTGTLGNNWPSILQAIHTSLKGTSHEG